MDNKPKVEKVVSGPVEISTRKKIKDAFIKSDGKTIREYAFFDVFIPSLKRLAYDLINKVSAMTLFNDKTGRGNLGSVGYSNQYQQQTIYQASDVAYKPYNPSSQPVRQPSNYPSNMFDYESWVFTNRGDIEAVLNLMTDIIDRYGTVSLVDLYDSVDKRAPYTAENYGWKSMNGCEPVICSGGWRLKMTRPSPINILKN